MQCFLKPCIKLHTSATVWTYKAVRPCQLAIGSMPLHLHTVLNTSIQRGSVTPRPPGCCKPLGSSVCHSCPKRWGQGGCPHCSWRSPLTRRKSLLLHFPQSHSVWVMLNSFRLEQLSDSDTSLSLRNQVNLLSLLHQSIQISEKD